MMPSFGSETQESGSRRPILPRVFEMFVQTDGPVEGKGGLGIGLALAKSLVERHDGRLTIESEGRGRGTEAVVRLPALTTTSGKRLEDESKRRRRPTSNQSRGAYWSSTTITTQRT